MMTATIRSMTTSALVLRSARDTPRWGCRRIQRDGYTGPASSAA